VKSVKIIIILALALLIQISHIADAKTYTVNFSSIGGLEVTPDSPHPKAWHRDTRDLPSNPYYTSDRTPFTQADIDLIESPDSSGFSSGGQDTHHFYFSIPQNANVVVRWRGHAQEDGDYVTLYYWDGSSWQKLEETTSGSWTWISGSFTASCEAHILAVGHDGSLEYTHPTSDYVEIEVSVANPLPVSVVKAEGNPRNYDGFFDTDTITLYAKVVSNGNPVPDYPVKFYAEFDSQRIFLGGAWTNSSGIAKLSFIPKNVGLSDKLRVNFVAKIEDVMTNCNAYTTTTNRAILAENVAITPGSYDITLVGRMYYSGGADWVRVNWYVDENSVLKPYPIPVVQKFTGNRASVTIWKYGLDDYCTDPNCHREGIYGNFDDADWDGACIAVGSTTPMCGRDVGGACYGDPDGPLKGRHDCTYFSGYRVGPFVQMNIPDHALGFLAAMVIQLFGGGELDDFMRATHYDQHEGPYGVLVSNAGCGALNPSTEQALTHGALGLFADPKGGLGVVGFVGLIADNEHAIGIMMGHRYGIHPFTAIVTTVPNYPSDEAGWRNYMDTWLYYLLNNAVYIAKTTGEELAAWSLRYPTQSDVVNLNRAFNDFITDFLPYMHEVLWLVVNCGKTVNHPFIISTFVQFKDNFEIVHRIMLNSTLNNALGNLISEVLLQLPNVVGPPDASTGINYLLNHRQYLSYSEREIFGYRMLQLLDQLTEVVVTLLKEIPLMEQSSRDNPGWDFNWIAGCGEG